MISPLEPRRYPSAAAFHAGLEARLRQASNGDPRRLNLMRVQFAIARLLVRLELAQPGEWVAKGGTSLLARLDGQCRLSRDLDIQRRPPHQVGNSSLDVAVAVDAGDWMNYRVDRVIPLRQAESVGVKARVAAILDHRDIAKFDVDIVDEDIPVGGLSRRQPYVPLPIAGVPTPDILLYPVEDHVADKLSAMGRVRRYGGNVIASTRYRDLADLALLAASVPMEAASLLTALAVPTRHWARDAFGETGLRLPGPEWPTQYAAMIRAEPYVADRWSTADAALAVAKPLVDPALLGTASGRWDPTSATWSAPTP